MSTLQIWRSGRLQHAEPKQRHELRAWRMPRLRWVCSLPGRGALHRLQMPDPGCCCLQSDWAIQKKWFEDRRAAAELHPRSTSTTRRNLKRRSPCSRHRSLRSLAGCHSCVVTGTSSRTRLWLSARLWFQIPLGEAQTAVGLFLLRPKL